jgi:hypothetical protein
MSKLLNEDMYIPFDDKIMSIILSGIYDPSSIYITNENAVILYEVIRFYDITNLYPPVIEYIIDNIEKIHLRSHFIDSIYFYGNKSIIDNLFLNINKN